MAALSDFRFILGLRCFGAVTMRSLAQVALVAVAIAFCSVPPAWTQESQVSLPDQPMKRLSSRPPQADNLINISKQVIEDYKSTEGGDPLVANSIREEEDSIAKGDWYSFRVSGHETIIIILYYTSIDKSRNGPRDHLVGVWFKDGNIDCLKFDYEDSCKKYIGKFASRRSEKEVLRDCDEGLGPAYGPGHFVTIPGALPGETRKVFRFGELEGYGHKNICDFSIVLVHHNSNGVMQTELKPGSTIILRDTVDEIKRK